MPCKLSSFLQRDAAIIDQHWAPLAHGRKGGGLAAAEAPTTSGAGAMPAGLGPGAHVSPRDAETSLTPPVRDTAWLPAGTAPA